MRNEPRFVNERAIEDMDRAEATDVARSLDDPYTIIENRKTGTMFLVEDENQFDDLDSNRRTLTEDDADA